jgi:hypothetical protein
MKIVLNVNILLFRVESDAIGVFFGVETLDNFSSFRVPVVDHFIVTCAEKVKAVVCESDIPDCLPVSNVVPLIIVLVPH